MKPNIPNELSDYLLKLSEKKQAEFQAQWTWQMVLAQEHARNTRNNSILTGLFGLLGVIFGVVLTLVYKNLL